MNEKFETSVKLAKITIALAGMYVLNIGKWPIIYKALIKPHINDNENPSIKFIVKLAQIIELLPFYATPMNF